MKNKELIPKLRFPEFEGEWEMKKLGNITTKVGSGSTPKGGVKVYTESGIPFIRSQNVFDNQLHLDEVHIPLSIHEKMINSKVLPNDVLLNITGGSIGRSCVVPSSFEEGNVNQHVAIIRLNNKNNQHFLQAILSSFRGQKLIYQGMTGSGREGLNFQSIRAFRIAFPAKKEQQKIANFLTAIDTRLQRLAKKKEHLEQYKKGVMQKIFSQEIRFDIENEDGDLVEPPAWAEMRLGEIAIKKSSNIAANKIEENFGEYIIYGAAGILKRIDFYEEENDYISIVKDGAGVGRVFYCEGKSSVLGTMDIIKPKKDINTYYLYCLLEQINYRKYITGSTIPHIYFKDYRVEKVGVPSFKEQTKIANFLSAIDEKIELVAEQIEKTEVYKKGLLQQLFV